MNRSRRHFRSGLKLFFAAAIVWTSSNATAADGYVPFAGEKITWHGYDRYDFIMDDATGTIWNMWGDFHYVITGKDANGNVTYEGGWQNNPRMGMHDKYRFVENIFEELETPGELYLDEKTATLYFPPGSI